MAVTDDVTKKFRKKGRVVTTIFFQIQNVWMPKDSNPLYPGRDRVGVYISRIASHACGNFSVTSSSKLASAEGSIGRAFAVRIHTENPDQASFCPFAPREVSVLAELALGHLRYSLTDVPPQSNSPPDAVFRAGRPRRRGRGLKTKIVRRLRAGSLPPH